MLPVSTSQTVPVSLLIRRLQVPVLPRQPTSCSSPPSGEVERRAALSLLAFGATQGGQMKRTVFPAMMLAMLIAVTGCGGGEETSSASGATPEPTASRSAAVATTRPAKPKPTAHPALKWIRENYPGVSWASAITSIESRGDVLWAETKLSPGDPRGASICSALSAYEISETAGGFTGLTVRAADGQRLAWRMSLSDKC
jgi:hypothetical protein